MRQISAAIAAVCLFAALPAQADQCAWITKNQAMEAQRILKKGMIVVEYCEPCGNTRPGPPEVVDTVDVVVQEGNHFSVLVNQHEVDLAYLYLQQENGVFANVARLTGCDAVGVSNSFASGWYQERTRGSMIHRVGTIPANRPQWTETGIFAEKGDVLVVLVSGEINIGGLGAGPMGPDSIRAGGVGSLELKVGTETPPLQTQSQFVVVADTMGPVYVRVRDSQYDDNKGAYDVKLLHIPAGMIPSAENL